MLKKLIKWCVPHGIYNMYQKYNQERSRMLDTPPIQKLLIQKN
jgi:hypothetical protein